MKWKINLFVACLSIFCLFLTVMPPISHGAENRDELLKKILEKLENIDKRVNDLESRIEAVPQKEAARKDLEIIESDIEDLTERLDETETRTLVDKISLGAELRTRSDWYDYKDQKIQENDHVDGLVSNRFRLNLRSNVNDRFRFHARLALTKNWLDVDIPTQLTLREDNYSRVSTDTTLKVERAYADYFLESLPLAISFGRLPGTDSLPTEFRDNSPRKSTYPGLAYDMEADGIALTFFLDDLIPLPDPSLRIIYSRWYEDNSTAAYRDNEMQLDDTDITIVQLESGLPDSIGDSIILANFVYADDYSAPDLRFMGYTPVSMPESLGSSWKFTLFGETQQIGGSFLDIFASYSFMKTSTHGTPALYDVGGGYIIPMGLLSEANSEDHKGWAFHLGLRASLDALRLKDGKLGIEYNQGSRYWCGFGGGSEDPMHKLNTRGSAWDFYYYQPFNRYFSLRIGHTRINYDYSGSQSLYQTPQPIDTRVYNTHVLMDAKF